MSGLPGNHQAPRAPTATAGSIDGKGDISEIIQAAGRDINQNKSGAVKIYIINTKNITKNVFIHLDPHGAPEEGARIVRQILAESNDSESDDASSEKQPALSAAPILQDMVMEASKWDDIDQAIRTLQPKFKTAGCKLVKLGNTTPDDDNSQVFRIIQSMADSGSQLRNGRESPDMSHLENSAIYTISDGSYSRAQSPAPLRNDASSVILEERVPSLTTGTGSNEGPEQGTPEMKPQGLPLTSEGKILHYSIEGWLEQREERLKLQEEADVKHLKFMEWFLRHLMILLFLQWLWKKFYGDSDMSEETDDNFSTIAEHDHDGQSPKADMPISEEQLGDASEDEYEDQDPLWWLDPLRATCFQAWRDPFPEINTSFSESSSGSNNSSSARQDTPPPSTDSDSSDDGLFYDAGLCDEPATIFGQNDNNMGVSVEGRMGRLGISTALGKPNSGNSWARGSAMGKGVNMGGEVDVGMSSEEVKERLGIPSDGFGHPGVDGKGVDKRVVTLRLGIRRRQSSRF